MLNRPLLFLSLITLVLAGLSYAQEEITVREPTSSVLLSSVHMWKGERLLESGNTEEATEQFLMASRYLRNSPDPHFALARVYLRSSFMDAFLEFATGVQLLLADFIYQSLLVSNLAVILLIAVGLTIYTGAAVIVFRYAPTVWHSLIITLSPWARGWQLKAIMIGCAFSFFVIISGLGLIGMITWTMIVGVGLSWKFAVSSERRVLVALIVFLALFGFLLDACTRVLSTQQSESPVRLAAMVDRIDEQRLIEGMEKSNISPRFDPVNEFMRGLLALKRSDYNSAIERFNLASKFAPHNPAILNNLGVAYHGLERYQEAVGRFRQALRYGPREAIIHYNYAQTLNVLLQYDLSQQELAKASTLDFELTRSLVTQKDAAALVPMNLQTRMLWRLALDSDNKTVDLSYHPVESGRGGVAILILLTAGIMVMMRRAKVPARCEICGTTVQSQVARRRRRESLCAVCHRIKENGAPNDAVEEDLANRIRRKEAREAVTRIGLGLVVPGSAHYLSGRRSRGLALAFVVFVLLVLVAYQGALIRPIPSLGSTPLGGWSLPLFVVVYALYCWRSTVTAIASVREAGS